MKKDSLGLSVLPLFVSDINDDQNNNDDEDKKENHGDDEERAGYGW